MTKQEIIEEMERQIKDGTNLQWDQPEDGTLEGVKLEEEDDWGGAGKGSEIGYVLKVTTKDETFFVCVNGYYESNYGSDYSDATVFEAESYMKQVKDWRPVK